MGLADFDKREVAQAVLAQRTRTVALLESLDESTWEAEVVPGWRVREVAAHLITTDEGAVTGRLMRLGLTQRPMSEIEAWNEEQVGRWADRPIPSLVQALEKWGTRLSRLARRTPGIVARRSLPTPLGTVSLLWLAMLRVYDEWVHGEDVRRAVGRPSDDAPTSVEPVARQLLAALPLQTLPLISPAATGTVTLRFSDLDLPSVGFDLGEQRYGTTITGGSTIVAAAAPFVMVAAHRDPWRDAEAAGALKIEGDREAAETFLDALTVI